MYRSGHGHGVVTLIDGQSRSFSITKYRLWCCETQEGRICLFNDALKTCGKEHSETERGNPLPPLHGLHFPNSSEGSFICTIPHTGYQIPPPLLHQSWCPE